MNLFNDILLGDTLNELWFDPGSNKIHLKGCSKLWAEMKRSDFLNIEEK